MTKLFWPEDVVSPSWPYEESYEDTSIKSKFEDGSQQTRTKFTRSRRKWTLKWKSISREQYKKLMDFVINKAKFSAQSFIWTEIDSYDDKYQSLNPDAEEIEVRITNVGKWTNDDLHYWTGTLEFTEV